MPRKPQLEPSFNLRDTVIDLLTVLVLVFLGGLVEILTNQITLSFLLLLAIRLSDVLIILKVLYTAARQAIPTMHMVRRLTLDAMDSIRDIRQHAKMLNLPSGNLQIQERNLQISPELTESIGELQASIEKLNRITANIQNSQTSFQTAAMQSGDLLLVKTIIEAEDGNTFSLDYVQLHVTEKTDEQTTYSNEGQPTPIRVQMTQRRDNFFTVHFESVVSTPNAYQAMSILDFQAILSKCRAVRLVDVTSGITRLVLPMAHADVQMPDSGTVSLVRDLAEIQLKVEQPIILPTRDFTDSEKRTIMLLRTILHEGIVPGEWDDLTMSVNPQEARSILQTYEADHPAVLEMPETESLFGTTLPLGRVRTSFRQAELLNEKEIREELASPEPPASIELRFIPGTDRHFVKEYLDWVPPKP